MAVRVFDVYLQVEQCLVGERVVGSMRGDGVIGGEERVVGVV
jgi:hypothetical protein